MTTYNVHLNDDGAVLRYARGLSRGQAIAYAAELCRVTTRTIRNRMAKPGNDFAYSWQVAGREMRRQGVWIKEDYDPREEYART